MEQVQKRMRDIKRSEHSGEERGQEKPEDSKNSKAKHTASKEQAYKDSKEVTASKEGAANKESTANKKGTEGGSQEGRKEVRTKKSGPQRRRGQLPNLQPPRQG